VWDSDVSRIISWAVDISPGFHVIAFTGRRGNKWQLSLPTKDECRSKEEAAGDMPEAINLMQPKCNLRTTSALRTPQRQDGLTNIRINSLIFNEKRF
jgi:hypothetical protein